MFTLALRVFRTSYMVYSVCSLDVDMRCIFAPQPDDDDEWMGEQRIRERVEKKKTLKYIEAIKICHLAQNTNSNDYIDGACTATQYKEQICTKPAT